MSTFTITTPPLTVIHLHDPQAEVDFQGAFDELTQILDAHRNNQHLDFLSYRIFRWSTPIFQAAYTEGNYRQDNEQEIVRLAHSSIDVLVHDILVNPLSFNSVTKRNNPLRDPVRERDWVWEREDYEACQTLFTRSPLDGGEMLREPPPHVLARRTMAWAARWFSGQIPPMPASGEPTTQVATVSRAPMFDQMQRMIYLKRCSNAHFQRSNQVDRQNIEDNGAWIDQQLSEIRGRSSRAIARAEEAARAAEETLLSRLEGEKRSHQEAISDLQNQISVQNAAYQAQEAALQAEIALRDQTDTEAIARLNEQSAEANEAHRADTAGLHERIDTLTLSNANQLTSLEGQLNEAREEHATDVANISRAESRAVALANELALARAQLQGVAQSLSTQQTQNAQNTARVQQLEQQYAAAQCEIRQLAERAGRRHGRCSIS